MLRSQGRSIVWCLAVFGGVATVSLPAQFDETYESVNGTAAGLPLAGQNGWFVPPVASSFDFEAYSYAGNVLGIPNHPIDGGGRFAAGTLVTPNERAQHAVSFASAGPIWTASVDVCPRFAGTGSPVNNFGSFSLQPGTARSFIALARWSPGSTGATWDADLVYYTAANTQVTASLPVPAFQNLAAGVWFRWQVSWRFDSNRILRIRLVNLSTGAVASHSPADWYLFGGAATTAPLPTDVRLFVGGGAGNILAADNLLVASHPQEYQVNQVAASITIDGEGNDGSEPVSVARALYQSAQVRLDSQNLGAPFDVGITLGSLLPASHGGLTTAGQQIVGLNIFDPTLVFLNGGTLAAGFPGPIVLPLVVPAPFEVRAQMFTLSPSHPDGFALSAPAEVLAHVADGQHFAAIVDPGQLGGHPIVVHRTPLPQTAAIEQSRASIPPIAGGRATLSYLDPFNNPVQVIQPVQVDNVNQRLLVQGSPVFDFGQVFPPFLPPAAGPALLDLFFDVPIGLEIVGFALAALPPCYQTDVQWLPAGFIGPPQGPQKIESICDGRPNQPDFTAAQEAAYLAATGLGHVVSTGAPSDAYDCHGWTFTGGTKWINNDQVQKILDFNCYSTIAAGGVMVGDVVVYRDAGGNITHTGIVTMVDAAGNATEVESKWGALGRYKHAPGRVPPGYGTPSYHRTTRAGGNRVGTAP